MKLLTRWRQKLVHELKTMPPRRFCTDIALGWALGLWPMIGVRTLVQLAVFWPLKRSTTLMVVTNNISFLPFLALYFPHLRLGEWLWQAERLDFTFIEMWRFVEADPLGSVAALLPSVGHAITGWAVLAPCYFLSAYAVCRWWLRRQRGKDLANA